jgi:hypothetical protein
MQQAGKQQAGACAAPVAVGEAGCWALCVQLGAPHLSKGRGIPGCQPVISAWQQ